MHITLHISFFGSLCDVVFKFFTPSKMVILAELLYFHNKKKSQRIFFGIFIKFFSLDDTNYNEKIVIFLFFFN